MAAFPLLIIPFVLMNALMLLVDGGLALKIMTITLPSDAVWVLSSGDAVVAIALVFLYLEIFKSTRTGNSSIVDHVLSLVLFIVMLMEFVLVKGAGHSTFFLLMLMALIDVISGFTVGISVARRDVGFTRDA